MENNFVCNLVKLRKSLGLTQEQYAKLIGIKRCSLGAYEEGRCQPSIELFLKMATAFNVDCNVLFFEEIKLD